MKRRSKLVGIEDLLGQWLESNDLQKHHVLHALQHDWEAMLGERIAAESHPVRLSQGVLRVVVRSSAWLSELTFLRVDLRRRINASLERPVVEKLSFEIGAVPMRGKRGVRGGGQLFEQPVPHRARQLARARAEQELPLVADDELRDAIVRARQAQLVRAARELR